MKRQSDHPRARGDDEREILQARGTWRCGRRSGLALGLRLRRPSALAHALSPLLSALLALPLLGACQTPESSLTSPSSASAGEADAPRSSRRQRRTPEPRTANPDGRTFDNQPDYDAEAASLREFVAPRLPSPLPSDPQSACESMYTAIDAFYAAIETSPERRAEVENNLKASREDDLRSCVAETTPTAAACVAVLIRRRTAELPWLLDQCSRAYP